MFFNKKLQDGYKAWVKELYTRPNPYDGGMPLKDEPAVGIIQIQNEDGMFFWTMQGMPEPAQKRILHKQFGDWLVKKYGSLDEGEGGLGRLRPAGRRLPGRRRLHDQREDHDLGDDPAR